MLASVIAIAANAFNVSVEKIPLCGLAIKFDDRLFAFLLFLSLVYFWITFGLYYFIDIKNLPVLPHKEEAESAYQRRETIFSSEYAELICDKIERALPENYWISRNFNGDALTMDSLHPASFQLYLRSGKGRHASHQPVGRSENEDAYQIATAVAERLIGRYPRAAIWSYRRSRLKILAIRSAYIARVYVIDGGLPFALGLFAIIAI